MDLNINGKNIDLSRVLPLRMRDWMELEKLGVPFGARLTKVTEFAEICAYIIMRAGTVTREEVLDLPMSHPVILAVLNQLMGEVPRDDSRPTSTNSTSSPADTGGPRPTTNS